MKKFTNVHTRIRTAALAAPFVLAGLVGSAGAVGEGEITLTGAETNVMTLVGVGVAITTGLTVYKLGKRAAGRI